MGIELQSGWNLRIHDVNPFESTLLPHHQPVRELCTSWSQILGLPSFTWTEKMSFTWTEKMSPWNLWGVQAFWALAAQNSGLVSCNKRCTFLHHTLASVDRLYCVPETGSKFGSVTFSVLKLWQSPTLVLPSLSLVHHCEFNFFFFPFRYWQVKNLFLLLVNF